MFENLELPDRVLDERHFTVVDITDQVDLLKRHGPFHEPVMEAWMARHYAKNHGVACVSASLFDRPAEHSMFERMQMSLTATELGLRPVDFLPEPEDNWLDECGVWFYVRGNYLAMGNSRAIEKCWRRLRN